MSHRFPFFFLLFFALWTLWFALPTTREAATYQWRFLLEPTPSPNVASLTNASPRDEAFVETVYGQGSAFVSPTLQSLERLGVRFPNDASIYAAQIVLTSSKLALSRTKLPGPSAVASRSAFGKFNTPPSVYVVPGKILKSWFAATERGARLEPDNAFWDWAKIIGLLAAHAILKCGQCCAPRMPRRATKIM